MAEVNKEVIDRKFTFLAINPVNKKRYTENNAVVFCAKDAALPAAIERYIEKCVELGANAEHIASGRLLLERILRFQETEKRVPDTVGAEIERCIDGII